MFQTLGSHRNTSQASNKNQLQSNYSENLFPYSFNYCKVDCDYFLEICKSSKCLILAWIATSSCWLGKKGLVQEENNVFLYLVYFDLIFLIGKDLKWLTKYRTEFKIEFSVTHPSLGSCAPG